MGTYAAEDLLRLWRNDEITAEQAIGHLMQHIRLLHEQLPQISGRIQVSSIHMFLCQTHRPWIWSVQEEKKGDIKMGYDHDIQFRSTVRTVLKILLDEQIPSEERIRQATTLLLRLPVPMPSLDHPELPADDQEPTLYRAGSDGLPTQTPYVPAADERPLTEEEVALMLPMYHRVERDDGA